MDANSNPASIDDLQQVANKLTFDDKVLETTDPLALNIEDSDLIDVIDERIKTSKKFFEDKYHLTARREKNERYLFGRQIDEKIKNGEIKDYESKASDNVLYEIEATLKPLAMSKLPDIVITPGSEDPEKQESAKNLSLVVADNNKKREVRQAVALAFKHLPVYFTGILKTRWNSEKGKAGDMEFFTVNPEYVVIDHTATSKNPDEMSFIAHCRPMTVQEILMQFPNKKTKVFEELQRNGVIVGQEPSWKQMASEVKVWEVWFDWYRKKGTKDLVKKEDMENMMIFEPGIKWEKVCGVLWKYERCILDKMLDPNHDHDGEEKTFTYQVPGDESTKQEVTPEMMLMSALTGQQIPNMSKEKVYHNYFNRPHKPFYFMGYDQWGKIAYDETSRIEQNVRNQENLDDQNRTILDQLKKRVKYIWGAESGLTKADIQRMDMDNNKVDARVDGNPNEVVHVVQPERPDSAQFNALNQGRDRMYATSGSFAVRGAMQSDVATTNQIAREADFTRSDDLAEDIINDCFEWIARWQLQWVKLRYSNEHMKEILGAKGENTYIRLRRDSVHDGMEVVIKASSTDKLKAQRNAMDNAKLGPPYSNPLDHFRDTDANDPEGRTERGIMFMADPQGYYTKYCLGLDTPEKQAQALNGTNGSVPPPMGVPPQPAAEPQAPQQPTPEQTAAPITPPEAPPMGSPRGL